MPYPLLASFFCVLCLLTNAEPNDGNETVIYGGFAFAGRNDQVDAAYPYSYKFDTDTKPGSSALEEVSRNLIQKISLSLKTTKIAFGDVDKTSCPRVLALALTEERVLRESIGDFYKLVVQLGFEIIVLDFTDKKVVCSLPIFIELIDAKKSEFSEQDIVDRVASMVQGTESQLGEVMSRKLAQLRIRANDAQTLRVTSVTVGEKALPFLPESMRNSPTLYSQAVAQQFGSLLSSRANVALLPYAKDAANSKMTLRFKDGDAVQFKIPEPTYSILLDVKGFKKVLDKQTDAESLWIYGAWLGIKIIEPVGGNVFFETTVKYPVTKLVPASQKTVDEFPVVSEALKGAELAAIEAIQKDKIALKNVISKCQL
jgi:hypothetical protein